MTTATLSLSDLISPAYLQTQVELHAAPRGYGGKGDKWASAVNALAWVHGCVTVLDYGCGRGTLKERVALSYHGERIVREYDPAIPGKDALPEPADLVVSTDVLEHIEPERLDTVLAHLQSLTKKVLFVVIATRPSGKTLSDGRNAHLILETGEWWHARMEQAGFTVGPGPLSPSLKPSREWVALCRP